MNRQTNFTALGLKQPGKPPESLFQVVLNGLDTLDPTSIAASATLTATIAVTGAALGDYVIVAPPYDLQGIVATGYVSVADTVEIVLFNPTAGAIDLASGDWKVKVLR